MKLNYYLLIVCFGLAPSCKESSEYSITQRAIKYYNQGQYEQAMEACDSALLVNKNYAKAYRIRGLIFEKFAERERVKGNRENRIALYEMATNDYSKAILLDSNDKLSFLNRGHLYFSLRKYSRAIVDYSKCIDLDPKHSVAYYWRAQAYYSKKDYSNAEIDFKKSASINQRTKESYYFLGTIQSKQERFEDAIEWYTKAIRIDSTYAEAFHNRAWDYFAVKEYSKSIKDFSAAIKIQNDLALSYYSRGVVYTAFGEYNSAIEDFETAISLNSEYKSSYVRMLIALVQLDRYDQARTFYETHKEKIKKLKIDSNRWKFLHSYLLACIYELGDSQILKAKNSLINAAIQYSIDSDSTVEINEKDNTYIAFVFSKLGRTYEQLDSIEKAKNYYQLALQMNPYVRESTDALNRIENKNKIYIQKDLERPTLSLITHNAKISRDGQNTAYILGRAEDKGGIASVKINGTELKTVELNGIFTANIVTKPGAKFISIEAQDHAGNTARKLFPTIVRAGPLFPNTEQFDTEDAKFFALLIAAQNYKKPFKSLKRPLIDAKELKNVLVKYYKFKEEDVIILPDKSKDDIIQTLGLMALKMGPNDNFLVFFAGHGTFEPINKSTNEKQGFLVPAKATEGDFETYISLKDFQTAIRGCKAQHVLLIADACYSGSLLRESIGNFDIAIQYNYKSRQLMASANQEPTPDNSVFIQYLLNSLKENPYKFLTADALFRILKDSTMSKMNSSTLPICSPIVSVGDEGGQFVFIKK